MKKHVKDDFIFYVLLIVVIVISCILPKTGSLVIVDEFFDIGFVWIVAAFAINKVRKANKSTSFSQKLCKIIVVVVAVIAVGFFSARLAVDVVCGTKEVRMEKVEVTKHQGRYGFISLHYYLSGTDEEGERKRFEISADDYSELAGRKTVTVKCYERSRRIVDIY